MITADDINAAVTRLALELAKEIADGAEVHVTDMIRALREPVSAAAVLDDLSRLLKIPAPGFVQAALEA